MTGRVVSQIDLCRLFDVSENTARAWRRAGCPVAQEGGKGSPVLFNAGAVLRWREDRIRAASSGALAAMDMEEAKRRKLAAEAALAEMRLSAIREGCVERNLAAREVDSLLELVRARLRAVSSSVAPKIVAAPDTAAVREIVEDAIHEALDEISGGTERGEPDEA